MGLQFASSQGSSFGFLIRDLITASLNGFGTWPKDNEFMTWPKDNPSVLAETSSSSTCLASRMPPCHVLRCSSGPLEEPSVDGMEWGVPLGMVCRKKVVSTDASNLDWGVQCDDKSASGRRRKGYLHINCLEMLAEELWRMPALYSHMPHPLWQALAGFPAIGCAATLPPLVYLQRTEQTNRCAVTLRLKEKVSVSEA